jgi:hypothetical protein
MAGKGGARPGAGRKTIAQELGTADLAKKALIERYGSLELSLKSLLDSGEPALIKFVHEHAFGKPTEKVEHSGTTTSMVISYELQKGNEMITNESNAGI